MNCSILCSGKNKQNVSMSSAENFTQNAMHQSVLFSCFLFLKVNISVAVCSSRTIS